LPLGTSGYGLPFISLPKKYGVGIEINPVFGSEIHAACFIGPILRVVSRNDRLHTGKGRFVDGQIGGCENSRWLCLERPVR
jgi:hypothetical protein